MMEQKSMNLEWRECQTGNIIAPLPAIPGYPYGGPFRFFSHLVTLVRPGWDTRNVTDKWTFDISVHLQTGGHVTLTNDDFNIPGTKTVEEMKQAVGTLTVEEIAAKFQEKGYQPDDDTTVGMSLDWERDCHGSYIAQLPSIPGYQDIFSAEVFHFTGISTAGDWHSVILNRPNPTVFLYNIPGMRMHATTPEPLMNIVEKRLTPEMIGNLLTEHGYKPDLK